MTAEILVSVVIPTLDRAPALQRAIRSVAIQNLPDLEVVVVDDGSRDESAVREASNSMPQLRVSLIRHETNRGGAAARNSGIAGARGRYIAFLDSDDEWLPNKLSTQLEIARRLDDDRWLIYCQSVIKTSGITDTDAAVLPLRAIRPKETVGDYMFVNRGFIQTSSFLVPRTMAMAFPFNESLHRHQDYDFLLKLEAGGCRFVMVEKPLVVIHWEDFHSSLRGFSPQRSLSFLRQYGHMLSPEARSGFVIQQIVFRALRAGLRKEGLRSLFQHVRLRAISAADWINIVSLLLFKDTRLTQASVRLKQRLRRW